MHLAGVNKNVVLANITQQYAKAYGMSVDDINNLPATDPFKAKIISAANTMYNQQTLTQTMGWTP